MVASGNEVGKISIRVVPDLDRFREELQAELDKAEREVRGKINVEVAADTKGLRQEIQASVDGVDATVGVDADTTGVKQEIESAADDVDAKVNVRLNFARLRAELAGIRRGLAGDAGIEIPAKVEVDQNRFMRSIAALQQQVKFAKFVFSVPDFKMPDFKMPDFSSNGASELDKLNKSGEGASNTILGLTRVSWLVVGVFTVLAPAIGLVAGLLAGLPSLIAMFGAGAIAIGLGMDGIKKAAEDSGLFSDKNGDKKGGGGLGAALQELKATVSDVFSSGLTPGFQKIAALANSLKTEFSGVAQGLVDMFNGFNNVATSSAGMAKIGDILSGIGGFFTSLQPVVASFTSSFLTLGAAGANAFGTLLGPLKSFADGFGEVVARVTSNGVFEQAMTGMAQTLTGFFDMFNSLFESGLAAMGQLGPSLQNMFSGFGNLLSAAMPALTAFSAGIADTIGNLGNALAPAFTALAPAVGAIMPIFTQLATVLGTTLSQAVVALAPALTQIAQALGPVLVAALSALAPILTQVATTLGTVLVAAVQQLTPFLPQIVGAFAQLATLLGTGLASVLPIVVQLFAQLLPVLTSLWPAIIQLVQNLMPLVPAFFNLVGAVLQVVSALMPLVNIFAQVIGFVAQLIAAFAGLAAAVVTSVADLVSGVVSGFAGMIATVLAAIGGFVGQAVTWFQGLGPKISAACSNFGGILVSAGKALMDGLLNGIKAGAQAVFDFVSGIAGKIAALKGPLPYDKKVLIPNGLALMEGLNTGIEDGADDVYSTVKQIAKAIMEAMKEVFGIGLNMNVSTSGVEAMAGSTVNGLAAVNQQAQAATTSVKQFGDTLTAVPTKQLDSLSPGLSAADAKVQGEELTRQLALLEIQRKQLVDAKNRGEIDKATYKTQLDSIQQQKNSLGLQKNQLDYAKKYGDQVGQTDSKTAQMYKDMTQKAVNMPLDFGKSVASQFTQDIGISGGGALGALTDYGMALGTKYVFNVSNVDEAMAVQRNAVNREGTGVVGR